MFNSFFHFLFSCFFGVPFLNDLFFKICVLTFLGNGCHCGIGCSSTFDSFLNALTLMIASVTKRHVIKQNVLSPLASFFKETIFILSQCQLKI